MKAADIVAELVALDDIRKEIDKFCSCRIASAQGRRDFKTLAQTYRARHEKLIAAARAIHQPKGEAK